MIPRGDTLVRILAHRLERDPDRTAIVVVSGEREIPLTMRRLGEAALAYAIRYRREGITPGEVIVDLLRPGEDLLYSYLGALIYGAIPCILPFDTEKMAPTRYRENIISLMSITHPAGLVAERGLAAELRATLPHDPGLKAILERIEDPMATGDPGAWEGASRTSESIALLQHSSGTTGLQKGVALSHRAVVNQLGAYAPALRLEPDDVIVSWLPLYHDMGLIAGFLMPLLLGIKLVLLSPFEWVRAPWSLMQAVSRHRGTLSWLPNFAYNFCAHRVLDRNLNGVDLSSWRAVINCSEPMYAASHRLFAERFAAFGLRRESLATCYAMAENVFAVSQGGIGAPVRLDRVDANSLEQDRIAIPAAESSRRVVEGVSAGPPLLNCRIRIEDDQGRQLGERCVGQIALQSDCMLTGYYNRPDATESAMREGWFLTGDLGYFAEGEIFITGRKKDLIIVGGKNIFPQDLEELIHQVRGVHPGRVVVFGVHNPDLGTEEVAAVAEIDPCTPVNRGSLGLEVRKAVAARSDVVIRHLLLVDDRWLVKTSSGKLARAANREKFLAELGRVGP